VITFLSFRKFSTIGALFCRQNHYRRTSLTLTRACTQTKCVLTAPSRFTSATMFLLESFKRAWPRCANPQHSSSASSTTTSSPEICVRRGGQDATSRQRSAVDGRDRAGTRHQVGKDGINAHYYLVHVYSRLHCYG